MMKKGRIVSSFAGCRLTSEPASSSVKGPQVIWRDSHFFPFVWIACVAPFVFFFLSPDQVPLSGDYHMTYELVEFDAFRPSADRVRFIGGSMSFPS